MYERGRRYLARYALVDEEAGYEFLVDTHALPSDRLDRLADGKQCSRLRESQALLIQQWHYARLRQRNAERDNACR